MLSFALGPAIMWRLRSREAAPHPTCVVGDGVGVVWVLGAPSPPPPVLLLTSCVTLGELLSLSGQHTQAPCWPPCRLSLPGGKVEVGEPPSAPAAARARGREGGRPGPEAGAL